MLVNAPITTEHNSLRSLWWNLLLSISAMVIQYTCKLEKQIFKMRQLHEYLSDFPEICFEKKNTYTIIKLFCKKIRPSMPIFASKKRCSDF